MLPRPRIVRTAILAPVIASLVCLAVLALSRPRADRNRTYRIGLRTSRPYQFFSPDGSPDGFAVQSLAEAARRGGIRLQWVAIAEGPDNALRNGRVDLWPRLLDTPESRRFVHITEPWVR